MEKYKICPNCQSKNDPILFECSDCESDLTGVRITDEDTQSAVCTSEPQNSSDPVRICDCGENNPAQLRKCQACGEDISDISPIIPQAIVSPSLQAIDGSFVFDIPDGETVIGRDNQMSAYLTTKNYVSRTHAKLTRNGSAITIENLSATNFTYVNNEKIDSVVTLYDGDEIGLGGLNRNGERQSGAAYFLFKK